MNHCSLPCFFSLLGALVALCPAARAQSDLAAPKIREQVVADAVRVVGMRGGTTEQPGPIPNPFVPKESEAAAGSEAPAPTPGPTLAGAELLATLAARIPATGTVNLGGEAMLLLGQKRLKVGDSITISFEGRSYELSIAAVTSTSFTVKRGETIHTRPVRISAASTSTPTNRP